jgi:hypothetical protein
MKTKVSKVSKTYRKTYRGVADGFVFGFRDLLWVSVGQYYFIFGALFGLVWFGGLFL